MLNNEDALICPSCKNRFESPRILPCMESICNKCIDSSDDFECPLCLAVHPVPEDGFPINKSLIRVLNLLDENKILNQNELQKYRTHLKSAEKLINYLDCDMEKAKAEIKQYCESIKSKIVDTIDQQVYYLNDIRDELVDEVYLYEKECLKTVEKNGKDLDYFKKCAHDCQVLIQSEDLKKTESSGKISRIRNIEWKLATHKKKYKNFLFKNVKLIYNELKIEQNPRVVKRSLDELNLKNFKQFNLGQNLSRESLEQDIQVNQLENKKFLFNYLDDTTSDYVLEVRNFHQFEPFSKRFTDFLETPNTDILVKVFKNRIIYHKHSGFQKHLTIFDQDLEIINDSKIKFHFKDLVATESKIFCLKSNLESIIIYDWNLNKLMVVKQNSDLYKFTPRLLNLFANEEFLFFRESDCINMMTEDGQFIKKIPVEADLEIVCFFNDCFFVKNNLACSISVIDFNGSTITDLKLKNFTHTNFKFFLDKDQNFSCYDLFSLKLYLQNF